MPTKIALLGSGIFASQFYLPVLLKSAEVDLAALWSRSKTSVDKIASLATGSDDADSRGHSSVKTYFGDDGFEALLADQDVQAVIMALPITAQPPIVLRCLGAGKHVLSEKPVAKDAHTARDLIKRAQTICQSNRVVWRVAENMAHDDTVREMGQVLRQPALGPVLYWHMRQELCVPAGSKWHATEWRTIPDFQGGFILDGGVHMSAIVRVALPNPPARIISVAHLHRSHLPPHDIVMGIALPPTSAYTASHGDPFPADILAARIPGHIGQSGPHGSISLSWANAQLPVDSDAPPPPAFTFEVHCLNGNVTMSMEGDTFVMKVIGAIGSGVTGRSWRSKVTGLVNEVDMFARAARGQGAQEEDYGKPQDALWDLALIEALLSSNGKEVVLNELVAPGGGANLVSNGVQH